MQFCDLNRQYQAYKNEIDESIANVIQSSTFINGDEISKLEEELASFVGAKHAICCSSGSDALLISLMAYKLQPEDEVIVPAFSFIATASMVAHLNARPVFVDISPVDFNIDVSKIEEKITNKTRGIISVSLFGQCANYDAINKIADKYHLWVIEDAAQSFGATYKNKKSGNLTDVGITSFFPAKPLGCYGDGGAVFTNSDKVAKRIKLARSHGQEQRYHHKVIGLNARMDTIQAAILRVKLRYFESEIIKRQKAAQLYSQLLADTVLLPEVNTENTSVWAQYTISVNNRDALKNYLQEKGIPSAIHYPKPLPNQEVFKEMIPINAKFEVAEIVSDIVLSLPMHGFITEDEIREVAQAIIDFQNIENE